MDRELDRKSSGDSPDTVACPQGIELVPGVAAVQRADGRWVAADTPDPDDLTAAGEQLPSIGSASR
jgi:hypothetical protein